MLGNIKFVGALVARKMLASKVFFAILEELLSDPTPEALESVAALLTAAGPSIDKPDWAFRPALNGMFLQIKAIVQKKTCDPRVRCLLKDVLELREAGWVSKRPTATEAPKSLQAVAAQAAGQVVAAAVPLKSRASSGTSAPRPFDKAAYKAEVEKALEELRVSHDAREAAICIAGKPTIPPEQQVREFCSLLVWTVQEGKAELRQAGFDAAALLVRELGWQSDTAAEGLREFMEMSEDLQCDVPMLPAIIRDELCPCLGAVGLNA